MKPSANKITRIPAISGLKVLGILAIFLWHSYGSKISPFTDLGARMVEVYFVCSGMLEALHHHGRYSYGIGESLGIYARKLSKTYPAYLAGFLLACLAGALDVGKWTLWGNSMAAALNLLMLQPWFDGLKFSFDGASWFIASLLFCYLCTPAVSYVVGRSEVRFHGRTVSYLVPMIAFALLSALFEVSSRLGVIPGTYAWPPFRLAEYSMAFCAGCWILRTGREDSPWFGRAATLVEVFVACGYAFLCVALRMLAPGPRFPIGTVGLAGAVVLVSTLVLFRGVLSRLLSVGFLQRLSTIELPFYLFHQPMLRLAGLPTIAMLVPRRLFRIVLCLVATVLLAAAWKRYAMPWLLKVRTRAEHILLM